MFAAKEVKMSDFTKFLGKKLALLMWEREDVVYVVHGHLKAGNDKLLVEFDESVDSIYEIDREKIKKIKPIDDELKSRFDGTDYVLSVSVPRFSKNVCPQDCIPLNLNC